MSGRIIRWLLPMMSKPGSSPITLNGGTGPITIAPQTALESGSVSTTTTSIAGLTANSVTTTTDSQGHPTILPIWYNGTPDSGIIVIPVVIIGPPGVVPPPPGLPPIIIKPSDEAETGPESLTSPTSTKTSSSKDAGPTMFKFTHPVDEDSLQKLAQAIIASQEAKNGLPTQAAVPIESPKCTSALVGAYPTKVVTAKGDASAQELLVRLRQQVCASPCAAPEGVVGGYVGIATDDGNNYCEISVGVSKDVEVDMYWGSPAVGVEWQQCWDSTMNIINNCVKDKNNVGWWNG
ncbi:hypothetical protein IFR05_013646 [Cadophora sp. M221]|nr:hypothetical protein IFR05_013646 [Cadophora sp. M221]